MRLLSDAQLFVRLTARAPFTTDRSFVFVLENARRNHDRIGDQRSTVDPGCILFGELIFEKEPVQLGTGKRIRSIAQNPARAIGFHIRAVEKNSFGLRLKAKVFRKVAIEALPPTPANSFKLQLPDNCRIHDVFHASRLRAYTDPEMVGRKPMVMPPGAFEDREYEVQRISDHDFKFGNWFYRVEWKGYSPL
eukprot:SAG11_NODE_28_length_23154_cov_11.023856_2_plen_192_part_00